MKIKGSKKFFVKEKMIIREDFKLKTKNKLGKMINCSFYNNNSLNNKINTCIIYLHCNCGSRVESLSILRKVLNKDYSFASLDFTGSGNSDGEFISLGHFEQEDVKSFIEFLIKEKNIDKFILWGRSMGAVTAFLYYINNSYNNNYIDKIIWDSGFCNLNMLAEEISINIIKLPKIVAKFALHFVKKTILKKIGLDFEFLNIEAKIGNEGKNFNGKNPPLVIFIASKEDTFVNFKHSEILFNKYQGPKKFIEIKGDHNSFRNEDTFEKVFNYLEAFNKEENNNRIINHRKNKSSIIILCIFFLIFNNNYN